MTKKHLRSTQDDTREKTDHTPESLSASLGFDTVGGLLAFFAAAAFAFKGVFAKLAFGEGITIVALLFLRFVISIPLFWLGSFAVQRHKNFPITLHHFKKCFFTGFLFFICIVTDFTALSLIDVSIERVILFTYPAFILMFTAMATRSLPVKSHLAAFITTYIGIVMIAGVTSKWSLFIDNFKGTIWAMSGACFYALYIIKSQHPIEDMGTIRFTTVSNTITFLFLCIYFFLFGRWQELLVSLNGFYYISIIAIFCTVIPFFIMFEGIKRIGAARYGIISMIGPVITLLAAYLILNEELDKNQLIGALITLSGIFMLQGGSILNKLYEYLTK